MLTLVVNVFVGESTAALKQIETLTLQCEPVRSEIDNSRLALSSLNRFSRSKSGSGQTLISLSNSGSSDKSVMTSGSFGSSSATEEVCRCRFNFGSNFKRLMAARAISWA